MSFLETQKPNFTKGTFSKLSIKKNIYTQKCPQPGLMGKKKVAIIYTMKNLNKEMKHLNTSHNRDNSQC